MELKGSKTEANLMAAFAGESQARNKYTYYASKAKKEGYEQIAALFTETAENEKEHAKIWFKLLHGNDVPATAANLADAAGTCFSWAASAVLGLSSVMGSPQQMTLTPEFSIKLTRLPQWEQR